MSIANLLPDEAAEISIAVDKLKRSYTTYNKEPGLLNSFKQLFRRRHKVKVAVDDVSFRIGRGEFVGLIGPNGAGKTTLLKVLAGVIYPTTGAVRVLGHSPHLRSYEFLRSISFVSGQRGQLWLELPPLDTFHLNREIYGLPRAQFEERVAELSDMLQIDDILTVQARRLSLGQRRRCELALALLHDPSVLLLDEPTIGLDLPTQRRVHDFLRLYNRHRQVTVILTSHYMPDIENLCPRVLFIQNGTIIYDGSQSGLNRLAGTRRVSFALSSKATEEQRRAVTALVKRFAVVAEDGVSAGEDGGQYSLLVDGSVVRELVAELIAVDHLTDLRVEAPPLEDSIIDLFESRGGPGDSHV